MSNDILQYHLLIDDALRNVIKTVMAQVAEFGFVDEHHFYISFSTKDPNVILPPFVKAQYPEEMTIVLQHQFKDLKVGDLAFSVVLNFNAKPENLVIPFKAITSFADPSVNFALQMQAINTTTGDSNPVSSSTTKSQTNEGDTPMAEIVSLEQFRKQNS